MRPFCTGAKPPSEVINSARERQKRRFPPCHAGTDPLSASWQVAFPAERYAVAGRDTRQLDVSPPTDPGLPLLTFLSFFTGLPCFPALQHGNESEINM